MYHKPKGECSKCHLYKIIWVKKKALCKSCYEHIRGFSSIKYMNKSRFGGFRKIVLKRDKFTCQQCGMTNKKHKELWSRELSIDHIDKKGRYSKTKNHNLSNLRTLCLRCHSRKDTLMYFRDISLGRA